MSFRVWRIEKRRTSTAKKMIILRVVVVASFLSGVLVKIARADGNLSLLLPIDCELGVSCFIQNYVDHDRSDGVSDYKCGPRTYNGHDGTDIRLLNGKQQKRGVRVLAAASGEVVATRDGMDDISIRQTGKAAIVNRECGNGVILDHGGGWRTQYCHLAKSSIAVERGTHIKAGGLLGLVGLSGETEFYHLHFGVKRNGRGVDPFAYYEADAECGEGVALWAEQELQHLHYRETEIVNQGFSEAVPNGHSIEEGEEESQTITTESSNVLAFVRAIGLQRGDRQLLVIQDPSGREFAKTELRSLEQNKAQYLMFTGKRRGGAGWQTGSYTARYELWRQERVLLRREFNATIGP